MGPALARFLNTMPASIYLYPVETQVFGLVSGRAGHTECTDAEWLFVPIIHKQSLNVNSPLPSAALLFSPLFFRPLLFSLLISRCGCPLWSHNEFLMMPNGTPPPHFPPLAPLNLSVNYCGAPCGRRSVKSLVCPRTFLQAHWKCNKGLF